MARLVTIQDGKRLKREPESHIKFKKQLKISIGINIVLFLLLIVSLFK